MKKHIFSAIIAISFAIMGMVGLYMAIPHTGWLLFVSVIVALFTDWDHQG
ncbi:hypothetical protein LCGC14_1419360 [marine sediment metagenome]|uniref:Uncharacterized protein n=1 Tax=marine sediment metagenome TaxID=412755 RepID=A0A0F9JRP0_9ZZZZ